MPPAIATGPIVIVTETDDDGKPKATRSFEKGDYIPHEIVAIADAHQHSMTPIPHVDDVCPAECSDAAHKPKSAATRPAPVAPTLVTTGGSTVSSEVKP